MTYSMPTSDAYLVLGQELIRRFYAEWSPEEIRSWLMAQIQKVGGDESGARLLWQDSFDLYEGIMKKRIEQSTIPESQKRILTWPWSTWKKFLDPLDPGLLAVLSAADGAGKTLYSENIAEHWAKSGMNVVFVHFELNRALMLDRRMVRNSGITRRILKSGEITEQQKIDMQITNEKLRKWPGSVTYVHTPGWTMERVMGEVISLTAEDLCDVFIIDYLEKASASNNQLKSFGNNVFAREADNVEIVKRTAEGLERPALLLAQLSKLGKHQSFENLDRTAIRGAGEKTERANIVILLFKETSDSEIVQVRIDKNTMGACGTFEQFMDGAKFSVGDIQEDIYVEGGDFGSYNPE